MRGELSFKGKLKSILIVGFIIALGLALFKYVPMKIWGGDILFDASLHLTLTIFILYILWYFIDQNPGWRIPYLIFAFAVIVIVSIQRIIVDAHNDIGLLLALVISLFAIITSRWDYFRNRFSF